MSDIRYALVLLLAAATGCATAGRVPSIAALYNVPAAHHDEHRNPVVVIPGILGSRLKDPATGTVVWGAFGGGYADPRTPDGLRLIALPMAEGAALRDLRDDVMPDGVLDRVRVDVLGLPLELNAYHNILGTLGAGGYRDQLLGDAGAVDYGDDHYTCFQFGYDWRRDLVESAQQLHEFILAKRAYVQEELTKRYGPEERDVKFDIVAHSMGGLVTRYYLMYGNADLPPDGSLPPVTWAGAQYVDKVIIVGTPHAGAAGALLQLVQGTRLAPIVPAYPPALLGTMPSIYQLLPRGRHGALVQSDSATPIENVLDPQLWESMRWSLADPAQDRVLARLLPGVDDPARRRAIALDHQRKCLARAAQFQAAIDVPAEPPPGLRQYLYAGDAEPTPAVIAVEPSTGRIRIERTAPGDGTVLRTSALMDERIGESWTPGLNSPVYWTHVTFLFRDHLGLTKDPTFADNVLFSLLEARPRAVSGSRHGG